MSSQRHWLPKIRPHRRSRAGAVHCQLARFAGGICPFHWCRATVVKSFLIASPAADRSPGALASNGRVVGLPSPSAFLPTPPCGCRARRGLPAGRIASGLTGSTPLGIAQRSRASARDRSRLDARGESAERRCGRRRRCPGRRSRAPVAVERQHRGQGLAAVDHHDPGAGSACARQREHPQPFPALPASRCRCGIARNRSWSWMCSCCTGSPGAKRLRKPAARFAAAKGFRRSSRPAHWSTRQVPGQRQCLLAPGGAFGSSSGAAILGSWPASVQPSQHALRAASPPAAAISSRAGAAPGQQLAHADVLAHRLLRRCGGERVGEELQRCPCFHSRSWAMRACSRASFACHSARCRCPQSSAIATARSTPPAAGCAAATAAVRRATAARGDRTIVQPCLEVVGQRIGGGVTLFRVAAQAGLHDGGEVAATRAPAQPDSCNRAARPVQAGLRGGAQVSGSGSRSSCCSWLATGVSRVRPNGCARTAADAGSPPAATGRWRW